MMIVVDKWLDFFPAEYGELKITKELEMLASG